MSDLSLDLKKSSATYNDLLIKDGDLVLTSDAETGGTQPVLQNILQRLRFMLGEWFMDNTQGLPWIQQIFVKNPNQANIDALLLNTILGTPGVLGVSYYNFQANFSQRILNVQFNAISTSGPITYSGTEGA